MFTGVRPPAQELRALANRRKAVLCIDIGNSKAKACVFLRGQMQDQHNECTPALAASLAGRHQVAAVVIGAVGATLEAYQVALHGYEVMVASRQMPLPFGNPYRSAGQGVDRLAAVCGAMALADGPLLVMDAGSCLTYEVLTAEGQYEGGAISPGLAMRLRAMHSFTAGLPLLSPVGEAPLAGLTTEDCMMSGALNGIRFEAASFQAGLSARYAGLQTILTGGAASVFEGHLAGPIFVEPNLVPEGLLIWYWYAQGQPVEL